MGVTLPQPNSLISLLTGTKPSRNTKAPLAVLEAYYPNFKWDIMLQPMKYIADVIADASGSVISEDPNEWLRLSLFEHNNDFASLWYSVRRAAYVRLSLERTPIWITGRYGPGSWDWVQLRLYLTKNINSCPLFGEVCPETETDIFYPDVAVTTPLKPISAYVPMSDPHFYLSGHELVGRAEGLTFGRWVEDWYRSSAGSHNPSVHIGISYDAGLGVYRPVPLRPMPISLPSDSQSSAHLADAISMFNKEAGWSFAWFFFVVINQLPASLPYHVLHHNNTGALRLHERDIKILENWINSPYFL
ncbi:hypothetical protein [Nitrospirillum amazonense]|uniref:hypothetical protein n=1 Tax=Nitrospirillum amazonense TaxID=28077 RepID=UPI002412C51E|nr:hypothetical protein [Nitrospirillum amazonense]MDG3444562.1 hypothetical protein [Nitrospirillum amazonense]